MVGSISEPSSAVVAMVEPEIAENTVPATIAITDRRPGTRRISSAKASMALSARPVWNSTSPISTKNGIGVSEKLVTDCTALRASCASPGSPPRKSQAPTMLIARNANATGSPSPMTATSPPNRMRLASIQPISADRGRFVAALTRRAHQAMEAQHEFEREQREAERQRPQQPPLGKHQVLDRERAEADALQRDRGAIPEQHDAGRKAENVGGGLAQPRHARRDKRQHHVDAHMLAAPQQPRRRQQRDDVKRVFGDLVGPGKAPSHQVAQHDIGRDQNNHCE